MASITCGNCKLTHTTVVAVRECYADKAMAIIANNEREAERREMHPSHASNPIASKLINQAAERKGGVRFVAEPEPLFEDEPDEQGNPTVVYIPVAEPGQSTRNKAGQTKPGFYKVGKDVFKVTPARTSDRTFAHKLVTGIQPERGDFGWEYLGLGRRYVPEFADKLTLDEAKTFGHTHGYCLICGRLLTAEQSVADGIGPICAGKL